MYIKKSFVLFALLMFFNIASAAVEKDLIIQPGPDDGKDTYYGTIYKKQGAGNLDKFEIGGWGDQYYSFLEFDTSLLPRNAVIIKAEIFLWQKRIAGNINYAKINRVLDQWNEQTLSLANHPPSVDIGLGWIQVLNQRYWWSVDVRDLVSGWVAEDYPNNGIMVEGKYSSNSHQRIFVSSDDILNPNLRPYLKVTYTVPDKVDPLVLQYMPVLAMGEGEDYNPMDVGMYVGASALWDKNGASNDTLVKNAGDLTMAEFESIVGTQVTDDYYLAFSDPDTAKSVKISQAKVIYDTLAASTTVYYRKMDDGDYTVLQYWYFYAANNWKEQGGFNDHEGDWESVFVYLDKVTSEPKYVAYSAHHNDGDPSGNVLQYDSVRRTWDGGEIVKEGDSPVSFVAVGSHANYPLNKNGKHWTRTKFDKTSDIETNKLRKDDFTRKTEIQGTTPFWMNYAGLWGADQRVVLGGDGPKGPKFNNVSGFLRFINPVAWAGIDTIDELLLQKSSELFYSEKTGVGIAFTDLAQGLSTVKVIIEPYMEWISFGQRPADVVLLPGFWDITAGVANNTFVAQVAFPFDPNVVADLGGKVEDLVVYWYDAAIETWVPQDSEVDKNGKVVVFQTNHFSRYALGFEIEEEVSLNDLFDRLIAEIQDTQLRNSQERFLVRYVRMIKRFANTDQVYADRLSKRLLYMLERRVKRYNRMNRISDENIEKIVDTIEQIKKLLTQDHEHARGDHGRRGDIQDKSSKRIGH